MDIHTLHVEHAALLGLFTLLTGVNSLLFRGERGAHWFPLFPLFAFLGAMLIALRGTVPTASSIFFGALLFSLGYLCLHCALTQFFERGQSLWWVQGLLAALCAAALFRWGVLAPDTRFRLFAYSLLLGAQLVTTAWFVGRQAHGPLRWSSRVFAGLLWLLAANNLFRALLVLWRGLPADYLRSGPAMSSVLLATSVLQSAVIISYVWMTAAQLRSELEREVRIDPLTRALNRRAIEAEAHRAIARSRLSGAPVSAILLDLDDFKHINDRWGHQSGDQVLQEVSRCLEQQLRSGDQLARLGGDEFLVLLPHTSRREALGIAEALRVCMEALRFRFDGVETGIRASFGAAQLETDGEWDQLVRRCDSALYQVKHQGGNHAMAH